MKILFKDEKELLVRVLPESSDDLWWLFQGVGSGDVAKSVTTRAVKKGTKEERIRVVIAIEVEKVGFTGDALRLTGKIVESSDEEHVQRGRYHSLDIRPGVALSLRKASRAAFSLFLRVCARAMRYAPKALAVLLVDERRACFYEVSLRGVELKWEIEKERTDEKSERREAFFSEIAKALPKDSALLLGGPGFEKEALAEFLRARGLRVRTLSCYDVDESGVRFLLKRGALTAAAHELIHEEEMRLWESFLRHLGKEDGLAAYGWVEVRKALEYGAAEVVLVLLPFLRENPSILQELDALSKGTRVHLVLSSSPISEELKGLGSIAAVLRFRIA